MADGHGRLAVPGRPPVGADPGRQVQPRHRQPALLRRALRDHRFNNCQLSRSDHQAFFDVGIRRRRIQLDQLPDADNRLPAPARTTSRPSRDTTSRPTDGQHRPGPHAGHAQPGRRRGHARGAQPGRHHERPERGRDRRLRRRCPILGATDAEGRAAVFVPHTTCTFAVGNASASVQVSGDRRLSLAATSAGGSVPATLSLTLVCRPPRRAGAGRHADLHGLHDGQRDLDRGRCDADCQRSVEHRDRASGQRRVLAPAAAEGRGAGAAGGREDLHRAGLQRRAPVTFTQLVNATDALRTGSYSKVLTFTLSTTTP